VFRRYKIQTRGVLHLGANTGQEAEIYEKLGIQRVIWVEALEDVHARLVENVAKYPGHTALCACLSDKDGDNVVFNRANNESQSSSFLELGTHAKEYPGTVYTERIGMRTVRADTLLKYHDLRVGPGWFLNVDLQGAELLALKGLGDLLWCFSYAYIEVNIRELYKGCPMVEEIDAYLEPFLLVGRELKLMPQGWGDKLYTRIAHTVPQDPL